MVDARQPLALAGSSRRCSESTTRLDSTYHDRLAEVLPTGLNVGAHVVDIDTGRSVGVHSTRPVVAASTYKVLILLALARAAAAGYVDWTTSVTVPARGRTFGATGLSSMRDESRLSVRDLALLMIQVSDNAATDILQRLVPVTGLQDMLNELGLRDTVIDLDCAGLIEALTRDLGRAPADVHTLPGEELARLASQSPVLQARAGNRTTSADMTRLLAAIWLDRAGPPAACAEVRRILALQFAPYRFSTVYDASVRVSSKTGTTYGLIRNEVGVFEFPDGSRFAAAVFLRLDPPRLVDLTADAAVGVAAKTAIDLLRDTR